MADFSSFFPAAGGGGGFTKMNKYSTSRALSDATHKLSDGSFLGSETGTIAAATAGATSITISAWSNTNRAFQLNQLAGLQVTLTGGQVVLIVSNPYSDGVGGGIVCPIVGTISSSVAQTTGVVLASTTNFTVNLATDLGLAVGSQLGVFIVGGGHPGVSSTGGAKGAGSPIFYQNITLADVTTNLVLTIGIGGAHIPPHVRTIILRTESTISGGLTLSSANGTQTTGDTQNGSSSVGQSGIFGYGSSGQNNAGPSFPNAYHGFGQGGKPYNTSVNGTGTQAADGAILLYY